MEFLDNMLLQAIDYEWDTTGHLPTYSTLVSPWTLSICGGHLWLSIFHVSIFFHFFAFLSSVFDLSCFELEALLQKMLSPEPITAAFRWTGGDVLLPPV